jgi:two-component system, sporulation sensor kinase E
MQHKGKIYSTQFINQVLKKIDKLDSERLFEFINDLSSEREFFERILESMIEAVIVFDDEYNVVYINKMAKIIFGLKEKFFPGISLDELCENKYTADFLREILNNTENPIDHEINISFPEIKTLQVLKFPMVIENKIKGTILLFQDVTLQKEEQIKLAQAESLASLTTLAAGVAHEIRNPLGAIDIHIQILQRLCKNLPDKEKDDFLNLLGVIEEEIERLENIIKNFLFSVRPLQIEQELISLKEIMEELISFFFKCTK